ncbi:hypothetical protein BXU08_15610 [Sphingomonas sp. LM7]|nr:hypothetical protein BXU08_15610 [Sphingomonas sp. LM7]
MALAALVPAAGAGAQTAPPVAAAPEPARLVAAQALIEKFMPGDRRDAMIEQMLRPMLENMRGAMFDDAMFGDIKSDPKLSAAVDGFVKAEFERAIVLMKATMPAMMDAMARAYARRFTLDQLQSLNAFFDTPAGRAYAEQAPSLMGDPDVLAAQRMMMTQAMAGMDQRVDAFAAKVVAETGKED